MTEHSLEMSTAEKSQTTSVADYIVQGIVRLNSSQKYSKFQPFARRCVGKLETYFSDDRRNHGADIPHDERPWRRPLLRAGSKKSPMKPSWPGRP